jgi:CheY-specific phosphatase CheX
VDTRGTINLTLAEALAEALETMAFVSPQLVQDPHASSLPASSRLVRVNFKGHDTQGSLALAASKEFASTMASNLDVKGEQAADDALKELANVTCGLLLRMRPGGGAGFQLEPPQMSSAANANPTALFRDGDLVELQADGQLIAAQIIADDAFYGLEA